MSEKPKPTLQEAQALQAAMFAQITQVIDNPNSIGGMLDFIQDIAGKFDLQTPDEAMKLANLRAAHEDNQNRDAKFFAARWAGDLPRMRELNAVPRPDLSHLLPDDLGAALTDMADDEDDCEDETSAEYADWTELPDRYGDLAAGLAGAAEALIASGQDLNQRTGPEDLTALQAALAAPGRNVEVLQSLVAAGADPRLLDSIGSNLIHFAIGNRHQDTVTAESEARLFKFLFDNGSDPNAADRFHHAPLHMSILLGSATEVALLLDAGADLRRIKSDSGYGDEFDGFTPLMLAAAKPETFALLLRRGADPQQFDGNGRDLASFLAKATTMAQARAVDDWDHAHAAALTQSSKILREHL